MNDISTRRIQPFMTVREVANALGTAESTIRNKVAELFPGITENGKTTLLTEEQVTEIKESIAPRTLTLKSKLDNAVTDIEMSEMTVKVLQFHIQKSTRLEAENKTLLIEREVMLPKVEAAEALTRCDKTMSITETAKHFGLHPKKQVFPYLRAKGFLTSRDLPAQTALDKGILAVRQNPVGNGEFYTQAVVEKSALDLWRTDLVGKIIEWASERISA